MKRYMKGKVLMLMMVMSCIQVVAMAQNDIDDMVDKVSTMGNTTFTSAVERNKQTGKVEKVVKKLQSNFKNLKEFIHAFEAEKGNAVSYTKTDKDNEKIIVLVTEGKTTDRVYMLKYRSYNDLDIGSDYTVSIIIKYKKQ